MKLQISRIPDGDVRVTLVADSKSKPIQIDLSPAQIEALMALLKTARGATSFNFTLEL